MGVSTRDSLGWIYFIQGEDGGLVKIGYSDDVTRRMSTLQAGSPVRLRLLHAVRGTISQEQQLHGVFKLYRQHGEWFTPAPQLMEFIWRSRDRVERERREGIPTGLDDQITSALSDGAWLSAREIRACRPELARHSDLRTMLDSLTQRGWLERRTRKTAVRGQPWNVSTEAVYRLASVPAPSAF